MNKIPDNVTSWIQVLDATTTSIDTGKTPIYIQGKDVSWHLFSAGNGNANRLTLEQIVEVSKAALQELDSSYTKQEITENELTHHQKEISEHTLKIIQGREDKRNRLHFRVARAFAYALAFLFSLVLIGIPFLRKLIRTDLAFHEKTNELRLQLLEDDLVKIKKIVDDFEAKYEMGDKEVTEIIQKKVGELVISAKAQTPSLSRKAPSVLVDQFEKDMNRQMTFLREDAYKAIKDETSWPSQNYPQKMIVSMAVAALHELVADEKDQNWEIALQSVTNQMGVTDYLARIDVVSFYLAERFGSWMEGSANYQIAIRRSNMGGVPPVRLEVIRDLEANIEEVHVRTTTLYDIVKHNMNEAQKSEVIVHEFLKAELEYTLTLDSAGDPVISDLHTQFIHSS